MTSSKTSLLSFIKRNDFFLLLVIFISGISLLGWLMDKIIIASVSLEFIPIAPSTALLFLVLSFLFLMINHTGKVTFNRIIIYIILLLSALFSILILIEFFFHTGFDIENIFIVNPDTFGKVTIGRMSPITAMLFFSICISILAKINHRSKYMNYMGGSFSLLTSFVAFVLVLGYLYKAPFLYGGEVIPVALLTAICFLLFGITLLKSYELKYWTFNLIKKDKTQYLLLKTFLPLLIAIVVFQGLIETNFLTYQKNHTLTTALIIIVISILTVFIMTRLSAILGRKLTETENELEEKSLFLDKVIESSALGTWIYDDKGTVIKTNPASLDFFGVIEKEVIGKYNLFKDNVLEEKGYLPVIREVFEKGKHANIIVDYDFSKVEHVYSKGGLHKIVNNIFTPILDSKGKVRNVIVQAIDLSEIKAIEEEAIKERNKAQQYLDIAGVMLLSTDADGTVKLINPKGCEMLEYQKEEILGENWHDNFLPEREISRVRNVKKKAMDGDIDEMSYFENYIKTKSGEERLIAWRNSLLKDENGNITGMLSSGEDITDRKRFEEELIKAKERAEESDYLKTAFLQNMSHEIRTPMNSIMGFASLLPEENEKSNIDNYSNIICKNSEQLVHIIDDIVLISRLQNKQMPINSKEFDFIKLLNEVKSSFNLPEYQNGVELNIEVASDTSIIINSDYEKIWQIYANLISNAFKYTPKGEIKFGVKPGNEEWICFVSDTGMGIPEKEISKIFERFYRASNVDKTHISGTGLGLSIVQELVHLLGGKTWIESTLGEGSTFYFSITKN